MTGHGIYFWRARSFISSHRPVVLCCAIYKAHRFEHMLHMTWKKIKTWKFVDDKNERHDQRLSGMAWLTRMNKDDSMQNWKQIIELHELFRGDNALANLPRYFLALEETLQNAPLSIQMDIYNPFLYGALLKYMEYTGPASNQWLNHICKMSEAKLWAIISEASDYFRIRPDTGQRGNAQRGTAQRGAPKQLFLRPPKDRLPDPDLPDF